LIRAAQLFVKSTIHPKHCIFEGDLMRVQENYVPYYALALILTLAILVTFQVYIWREPDRIAVVESHDKAVSVSAGQALFKKNCTLCHGDNGEGTEGRPALNDKSFLASANDETIFSVVSSGIPNTGMPAWNQAHGGPMTDEDVRQVVAFLRAWEPAAPDRKAIPLVGNPSRGKTLFSNVCAACHGSEGAGTARAPMLNDPAKLTQFDDAWYQNTITKGRPAQGMPTWGTVLSPVQIADVIAYIDTWRQALATAVPAVATPDIAP
jgi:cbb3-type cytochrome c oxidase subunit III